MTLLDGMVLARSTFHHSINYRSVVIFGPATEITEPGEKSAALALIVDHPSRTVRGRQSTDAQGAGQTRVVSMRLDEMSAKVRTGPPIEDEADLALPVWAGVLPLRPVSGPPLLTA